MSVKISIVCPKCGKNIEHEVDVENGIVPLTLFLGEEWECDSCGTVIWTYEEEKDCYEEVNYLYYGEKDEDDEW